MSSESFEKMSPMISILILESYVQPGLADHAASRPSAFPKERKKRNHRPILSFYRWRTEAQRVKGVIGSAWQTQEHIMVSQFTQFSAISATVAVANLSFYLWRGEKR